MRGYFWNNPVTAAKAVQTHFPADAEECLRLADEICQNRFCFRGHWEMERTHEAVEFPHKIVWDKTPNGDMEWVYAFNRHSFLVTLGRAWRFTQNRKYADAAFRLWNDWLSNVPLTDDAVDTTWRPIECGLRCETWLRAVGLFEGILPKQLLNKINDCLLEHGKWLMKSHTTFQKLSNWGILQDHGLLLLGLYFENSRWRDTASTRLNEQLSHQVLADGTHWEQSPLYHCEVLHCCLDSIHVCKTVGFALSKTFTDKTHLMSTALGKMLRPDGKLFCQSDSDEVDARDILAHAAILFGDSALKGYANGKFYAENCWDFADNFEEYNNLNTVFSFESTALEDSGNYMLWDGVGTDAGMLHFHCGSLGSGHGHADLLHIDLTYNSETILSDSGRYTYVDSEIRKTLKHPSAHNTVLVDETDFTVYKSSWSYSSIAEPIKGSFKFTPHVDFVSGAHLGYLSCGVFTRRRILRLGSGLWLVWDDFCVSEPSVAHIYDRYFHFSPNGNVQTFHNSVLYTGTNVNAKLIFPGENINIHTMRSPVSWEYNLLEQSDCIYARSTQQGSCGFATVISVGDTLTTAQLSPIKRTSTGKNIPASEGEAIHIKHGEDEWTVMLLNTEVISEVSLLESHGHMGYGKVQVFGSLCPDGICLCW